MNPISLSSTEKLSIMCFGYHKYTHLLFGLLITCVFILYSVFYFMFIENIRYFAFKIPLSRMKYYQSHIKP